MMKVRTTPRGQVPAGGLGPVASTPGRLLDAAPPVPQRTLVALELRKTVDTRSGRWVFAVILAATVGMVCLVVFAADRDERDAAGLFSASQTGVAVLLPVVAAVAMCAEWTQRTALTTFALVPDRGRTVVAKWLAMLVLTAVGVGVGLVAALGGHALGRATGQVGADVGRLPSGRLVATSLLDTGLSVTMGLALGMLLANATLSILTLFGIPAVLGILSGTIGALERPFGWLNPGQAFGPLGDPATISATEWARVGTAAALWVLVPFAAGWWRTVRRDVS